MVTENMSQTWWFNTYTRLSEKSFIISFLAYCYDTHVQFIDITLYLYFKSSVCLVLVQFVIVSQNMFFENTNYSMQDKIPELFQVLIFWLCIKKKISMILNSNFHVLKPSSNHLQASVGMAKFRFFFEKPSIF